MKETTTHCDFCGNPLGIKCDRTAASAVRAKISGISVVSMFIKGGLDYKFFCNVKCWEKFHGEEEIHKT